MHKSVLLNEILTNLSLDTGEVFVDATLGAAGHSFAVCQKYKDIEIIGLELDSFARELATERLKKGNCRFKIIAANFRKIKEILAGVRPAAILFDLGLSSMEISHSRRGFSFGKDEPLLMTFGEPKDYIVSARDIVNNWSEENLRIILKGYGEERYAGRIAKVIASAREKKPITTTGELVALIKKAVPAIYRRGRIHFATKTFQALRIAVNDELGALLEALPQAFEILKKGGRIFVISFHSLEDRIVKRFFQEKNKLGIVKMITKKPITASTQEINENPRARSAKLRIIEKIS